MAVESQISAIVASQLGRLEGEIEARVIAEANKLVSEFANRCPNQDKLLKIIAIRNSLLSVLNSVQKQANKFNELANKILSAIRIAGIIIRLLKRNPTPVTIGTPPGTGGGVISTKSAGSLTSLADRLYKTRKLLEALEGDVDGLKSLTSSIGPSIQTVKSTLESVDIKCRDCASGTSSDSEKEELEGLLSQVQPLENTGTEGSPNPSYDYRSKGGFNYKLSVIQDMFSDTTVPRRVAVAKDIYGTVVLRGQPSFSSDPQVLIDELKFRIDNQLP